MSDQWKLHEDIFGKDEKKDIKPIKVTVRFREGIFPNSNLYKISAILQELIDKVNEQAAVINYLKNKQS